MAKKMYFCKIKTNININRKKMKKIVFFVFMSFIILTIQAQEKEGDYVDLGLTSGTLWKKTNEAGLLTYNEAVSYYGNKIPSKEQWIELRNECEWTWTGMGYKVMSKNGNFIILPAAGVRSVNDGKLYQVGTGGFYWSSSPNESDSFFAWYFSFKSKSTDIRDIGIRGEGQSVRLVKKP